ncbi:MAG: glutamate racemase [Oscillospiraceae bacterium]
MDNRPIGVFDSGLGGLTAMRELMRLMPGEDLIYFGDTGRVPYGSRSRDTILRYARQDVAFLRTFDLKAIVIACGTVSTAALDILTAENPDLPIFGVVDPAAHEAVAATKSGRIGLIGTAATIRSGVFAHRIVALNPKGTVTAAPCPLLVPLVENGRFRTGDTVVETVLAEYLAPMKAKKIDTLVLGCTHYPLLKQAISAYMGETVSLIDTGATCARAVANQLQESGALSATKRAGTRRFFASDSAEDFGALASIFLGEDIGQQVEQIKIEDY